MKAPFHQERILTNAECDRLIALWDEDHGHGGAYTEDAAYISKRTSIIEMPDDLFAKVSTAVDRVNARLWGYAGDYAQAHELYRYTPGDFFDWHMDLGDGDLAFRKVTTLIQLSDPADYDGGRLELWANEEHQAGLRRGTLLVYPSFLMHRVTEVTRGVRYSLGGELLGDPFR